MAQEAMIYILGTLYFWKVSKQWFYFTSIGYVQNFLGAILLIWMPESPRYLVTVGKLNEAKKAFSIIAWYNRKPLVWDESKYS